MRKDDPRLSLLAKFLELEEFPDGPRYVVGSGDRRARQRGTAVATISLKHAHGYVVMLSLDDGTQDVFHPQQLFPEQPDTNAGTNHE